MQASFPQACKGVFSTFCALGSTASAEKEPKFTTKSAKGVTL